MKQEDKLFDDLDDIMGKDTSKNNTFENNIFDELDNEAQKDNTHKYDIFDEPTDETVITSTSEINTPETSENKTKPKFKIQEHIAQFIVIVIIVIFAYLSLTSGGKSGKMPGGMGGAPAGMGAQQGAPQGAQGQNAKQGGAPQGAKGTGGSGTKAPNGAAQPNAQGAPGAGKGGNAPQIPQGMGAQKAANTVTVSIKEMKTETIASTIKINGDVSSKSEVNTYPITSGKITQLKKTIGDNVKKGEIFAYLDPSKPGSAYTASPIMAPVSGTIIAMNVNKGDTVSSNTAIATIGSLSDLEINVYVSEKYANYLEEGLPAYISLTSSPNEIFNAKIASISPVVDKNTRTLRVELALDSYDKRIKPGMFASVNLVIKQHKDTFVIPKKALKTYNNDSAVFIVDSSNIAQRVIVETGISNDTEIEITSGLQPGQKVITAGSVTVGTPVKISKSE